MQIVVDWTWKYWTEASGGWELLKSWAATLVKYPVPEGVLKEYFELAHAIMLLHRKYCQNRKYKDVEKDVWAELHVPKEIETAFSNAGKEFNEYEENFVLACVAVVRAKKGGACLAHYAIRRRSENAIWVKVKKMFEQVPIPTEEYEAGDLADDR